MLGDKHLAYEIDQMRVALELLYEIWPEVHGATPSDLGQGVAYFESALVHIRNLIEFLVRGPLDHEDSLRPDDFGMPDYDYGAAQVRFTDGVGEGVDDVYSRICTYVSHLSKARDLEIPNWELQPLEDTLVTEAAHFLEAAEQAGEVPGEVHSALGRYEL